MSKVIAETKTYSYMLTKSLVEYVAAEARKEDLNASQYVRRLIKNDMRSKKRGVE